MTDSNIQNNEETGNNYAPQAPRPRRTKFTKSDTLLKLLNSKRGATIVQLQEASGWQSHSVRGFLSGTVKKKLGPDTGCRARQGRAQALSHRQ